MASLFAARGHVSLTNQIAGIFPDFSPHHRAKRKSAHRFSRRGVSPSASIVCTYSTVLIELFDLSPSPAAAGRHHPPGQHLPNLPAQEVVPTRPLPRPKVRRPRVGRDLPRPRAPQLELLARPRSLAASRQRVHRGPRVPVARVTRPSSPSPHRFARRLTRRTVSHSCVVGFVRRDVATQEIVPAPPLAPPAVNALGKPGQRRGLPAPPPVLARRHRNVERVVAD